MKGKNASTAYGLERLVEYNRWIGNVAVNPRLPLPEEYQEVSISLDFLSYAGNWLRSVKEKVLARVSE